MRQEQNIETTDGQAVNVDAVVMRFFLISYSWQNSSQYGTGNLCFNLKGFPSSKWIKEQCAMKGPFSAKDVVLTGIFEFKNSADFEAFCIDA